jgi:drug/metabolite transporter (DMT)-like permease
MDWFMASILSLVCIVSYRLFLKNFLSKKDINPTTFSILEAFVAMTFSGLFVLIFGFEFTGGTKEFILLMIKSMISGGAALLLTTSLKQIVASEYQIISSSRIFITILAGIIFFGEDLTLVNVVSAILVICAILLIAIRKNKIKLTKYHLFAFAATFLFGIVFSTDKYLSDYYNNFSMLLLTFVFSQLFKFIVTPENLKLVPKALKNKSYIVPTLITGSFLAGIYLFQYYAYQVGGYLSTVNIIKGTSTVFIVVLSAIFLKDKEILGKKVIAAVLVSLALILIKIF